jgi:hypothetical protein
VSSQQSVVRDERTVAIENASYKWACVFITFSLLVDTVYRSAFRGEAAWDLLALAIVPSLACSIYQARQKILGPGWLRKALLLACLGGGVGFVIAVILMMTKAR